MFAVMLKKKKVLVGGEEKKQGCEKMRFNEVPVSGAAPVLIFQPLPPSLILAR